LYLYLPLRLQQLYDDEHLHLLLLLHQLVVMVLVVLQVIFLVSLVLVV
jgi:hypothetical protein